MSDPALMTLAARIRLAVFDVDGVLTDGRIVYSSAGEEAKSFHTRDGLGLKGLAFAGIESAVITARVSPIVDRRMRELSIAHVVQGCEDKAEALAQLCDRLELTPASVCFTGDDLVDWPAMRDCGLRCAPADADDWIRDRVDFVTARGGGAGAAREVCELLIAARGRLEDWRRRFE
jgi:3-deoxy-D-manno-octulosonate 8-phosphate phosphatase (KDO 8-P phosphatase)